MFQTLVIDGEHALPFKTQSFWLASFPGHSHLQYLIYSQYTNMEGEAGIKYYVSDINVHQVDRGGKGPDHKNVFSGRRTTGDTYAALLMLAPQSLHFRWKLWEKVSRAFRGKSGRAPRHNFQPSPNDSINSAIWNGNQVPTCCCFQVWAICTTCHWYMYICFLKMVEVSLVVRDTCR